MSLKRRVTFNGLNKSRIKLTSEKETEFFGRMPFMLTVIGVLNICILNRVVRNEIKCTLYIEHETVHKLRNTYGWSFVPRELKLIAPTSLNVTFCRIKCQSSKTLDDSRIFNLRKIYDRNIRCINASLLVTS